MFRTSYRARIVFLFTLIAGVVVFASVKFGPGSQAQDRKGSPEAPQAASVVATLTDNVTAATKIAPGGTITYTATITNNGVTPGTDDATNVIFTDTLDANTTLVGGTLTVTPIVSDDPNYLAIGNVRIQPTAANGVLVNDINPGGGALTASAGALSTQGGNVTMNADGSFSYNPAPGFAGTDTFTYTATGTGGATANGTVTIKVGNGTATPGTNVVWFVNPAAAAGGDGRLTNPFNCYTGAGCFSAVAADDPGDTIFLYSGAHIGGYTLLNNQKLIGAGASATVASISSLTVPTASDALPATGGANPTITTAIAATSAITLGTGNTLRGFTVGNTTAAKILGVNFGTLTVGNNTTPDVTLNGTGQALNLSNGAFAATSAFSSVTSTSSTDACITMDNLTGTLSLGSTTLSGCVNDGIYLHNTTADINFGNTAIGTASANSGGVDGLDFGANNSGTRTFGTLNIQNSIASGILHQSGGGNITVTGTATVSSAGDAISISAPGATNQINFNGATSATRTAAGGNGVNWAGTSGALLFVSSLTIQTNGGTGLNATGGGQVNVSTNTGTINNTAQAAPAIVANGILLNAVFASINSTGGTSGVSLTNVTGTCNFGTGALSGASAATFLVSGGTVTLTYNGNITQGSAGQPLVSITGHSGGSINFNTGALSATNGTGLQFNNADGTYNFNGTTTLAGGDAGIDILNGSDGTFAFGANTSITNPSGKTFNMDTSSANVTYSGNITKSTGAVIAQLEIISQASGTVTFQTGTISLTTPAATGLQCTFCQGTVNFNGPVTLNTTTANGIIENSNAGTFNFGGAVNITTTSGNGFNAVNGGIANFTGGLTINTTSGMAFFANTGGTVNVCDETPCNPAATGALVNTLTSTTGTALNVVATNIGANNLEFRSISSNGAPNGIFLNGTGSSGGLKVKGNGGTCTFATPTCDGGRIQSTAGADNTTNGIGVYLQNTTNVSLTRMRIDNHPNFAIRGHGVAGLTLQNVVIDGNNGTSSTADTDIVNGEDSVRIINLTGSALIDDSFIGGGYEQNIRIVNDSGSLNRLTVSDSSIGDLDGAGPGRGVDPTNGDDNITFSAADGTLTQMNGTFTNNILNNARGDVFQAANSDVSAPQATMDIVFRGNTVSNNHPNIVVAGGGVTFNGTGAMTYDVSCNKFRDSKGHGVVVFKQRPSNGQTGGTWSGTIFNNRIGVTGVGDSGGLGNGLDVEAQGNGTHTTLIKNNQVSNYNTAGIFVGVVDANTTAPTALTMIATVIGNTTSEPDPVNAFAGFHTNQGAVIPADATTTLNLKLGGAGAEQNNFVNGDPLNGNDVALQRSAGAIGTFTLTQGASGVSTPVTTVVQNNNVSPITLFADPGITVVGPVPALPAATDQTCSPPPIPPPAEERISERAPSDGLWLSTNDLLALLNVDFGMRSAGCVKPYTNVVNPAVDVAKAPGESEIASANVEMPFWASIMPSAESNKASGSVEIASWNSIKASGNVEMPSADSIKAEGFAEMAPADVAKAPVESEKASALFAMVSAIGEMISPTVYSAETTAFSGETITVNGTGTGFTLPAGKTVTITYQATVNFPPQVKSVTTQGTVTGNGPGAFSIPTDDPEPVGGPQATATLVDTTMTWNGATSTDWNTDTNWTPPAGGASYAPGVSNPAVNDVVIPNVGNQPGITASDITVFSLNISNGRTLSITSPRVLTVGGSPGGDLILNGIIGGTGEFRFGTGTHVITNAGGTGSFASTTLATVLSGSTTTLANNLQAGALAVNAGGTLNITNRTLSLNGPGGLSVPGGTFTTTGSTVIFNGSGAVPQSLSAVTLNNMTVNNTGAGVSLTGNPTVNSAFTLTQGNVTTGANTLIVASGGTATRTAGAVIGKLQKNVVGGAIAPEAPQAIFTYPVGTATGYSPVTANFTAGSTGSLTVEAFDGTMPAAPPLNDATTLDRYWQMTETGTLTADLTLQYLLADVDGIEANYRLLRGTGGAANIFPNNCASTCVNPAAHTILAVGAQSFDSFWTAGEAAPTAANVGVSGRVYTTGGRAVAGAIVRMTDQSGSTVYALTNPFGYYHFEGVASGQDYVMTVTSKQYTFAARLVSVSDNITDLDFIAEAKE